MLNIFILGFYRIMLLMNIVLLTLGNMAEHNTQPMNIALVLTLFLMVFAEQQQRKIIRDEQALIKELEELLKN